jgi:hypothetical protein
MKTNQVFIFILSLAMLISCSQVENQWELASPDENLNLTVNLDGQTGQVTYSLNRDGKTALETSPMGIVFEEALFEKNLELVEMSMQEDMEERYSLISGKELENHAKWNELSLRFRNENGHEIAIRFRAYDDGMAFRYEFPVQEHLDKLSLVQEHTGFNLPDKGKAWMQAYDTIAPWAPAYETFYQNSLDIGTTAPENKNGWAFPMLFEANELWTLITETNLGEDYLGMHLQGEAPGGQYTLRLPEEEEALGVCKATIEIGLPFETPWRVVHCHDDLGKVVESNLVYHLSTPALTGAGEWIEPGKSSWSWWSMSDSPEDYETLKKFVDFSANMGWEYSLVDANWDEMVGGDLEQLAQYANDRGVGLLVWYNSGGPHNVITEKPRNLMDDPERRKAEFKKLQDWGVRGIKVDFFQSDKRCIIRLYHEILQDALDHEILVNFHGCALPRGWRRTYPNLMTMEAVRGAEAYKFDKDYPDYGPIQNTILPFTRNVIGPMDYTPVTFSDVKYPRETSRGHEMALAVLFESGIQHFADKVDSYKALPAFALEFLKNVPVAWDKTKLVSGYPGDHVILARQKGESWYISGIHGKTEPQAYEFLFSFLDEGDYQLNLVKDGESKEKLVHETIPVTKTKQMTVELLPRGGFTGVIKPVE